RPGWSALGRRDPRGGPDRVAEQVVGSTLRCRMPEGDMFAGAVLTPAVASWVGVSRRRRWRPRLNQGVVVAIATGSRLHRAPLDGACDCRSTAPRAAGPWRSASFER